RRGIFLSYPHGMAHLHRVWTPTNPTSLIANRIDVTISTPHTARKTHLSNAFFACCVIIAPPCLQNGFADELLRKEKVTATAFLQFFKSNFLTVQGSIATQRDFYFF
ncbi:MAG TPA: hypothetical protein VMB77_02085, partial [Syntrophales bacterium]|nr:hypothetical protein [Syntrophales bacterium]